MRILLVDDEPLILKSYGRYFRRRHGYDVVTASGGAEALAELEANEDFDLIFCDLSMPNIDGLEVHRAIRHCHPGLANRFVFLTGGTTTDAAALYLASSGVRTLTKPIRDSEFEKVIADLAGPN